MKVHEHFSTKRNSCIVGSVCNLTFVLLLIFQKNLSTNSLTLFPPATKLRTTTPAPALQSSLLNQSDGSRSTVQGNSLNIPSSLLTLRCPIRKETSFLSTAASGADASESDDSATSASASANESTSTNRDRYDRDANTLKQFQSFIEGPSLETKPNYDEIHGPLGPFLDNLFLLIFRSKFAENVGIDSKLPKNDYQGLMELTSALNARYTDKEQVRAIAQNVLRSLFPSWLPGAFGVMFAKPFPEFSSRMNAWATWVAGTWLMGECEINDCDVDGGKIGREQGLLVKRCRFLEECGCASVCVNSCKIPTQNFFNEDMKLPLTMTPDYDTGECQFSFGLTPTKEGESDAMNTPCFQRCPSSGALRKWHSANSPSSRCHDMEGEK